MKKIKLYVQAGLVTIFLILYVYLLNSQELAMKALQAFVSGIITVFIFVKLIPSLNKDYRNGYIPYKLYNHCKIVLSIMGIMAAIGTVLILIVIPSRMG